jgi:hypothetical protein
MQETPTYDAFISYKSDYRAWVETLARNLEAQGLSVWFDDWRKIAGDPIATTLRSGIEQARAGILVVTPEAAESGWVQQEYESMLAEVNRPRPDGSQFRLIPLLLRHGGCFPFLETRFVVDFRDSDLYERRVVELLAGVRGEPIGPNVRPVHPLELPPPLPEPVTPSEGSVRGEFNRLFEGADAYGIVALFAQEAMGIGTLDLITEHARAKYKGGFVLPVVPLVCTEDECEGYFGDLGRQLGLGEGIRTASEIGKRLPSLINRKRPLVLIVSAFENGPERARYDIASQLRNFHAAHHSDVRIIIRGGQELAKLKYEHGDISLLNIAIPWHWPELNLADVQRFCGGSISNAVATALLTITGGEPRMVGHCLRRLAELDPRSLPLDAASLEAMAPDLLADCDLAAQIFVPLRRETGALARLLTWLGRSEVGPFTGPLLDNPILRRLYWRNALCIRQHGARRYLAWRSDHLRQIGYEILRCNA